MYYKYFLYISLIRCYLHDICLLVVSPQSNHYNLTRIIRYMRINPMMKFGFPEHKPYKPLLLSGTE